MNKKISEIYAPTSYDAISVGLPTIWVRGVLFADYLTPTFHDSNCPLQYTIQPHINPAYHPSPQLFSESSFTLFTCHHFES